MKRGEGFGNSGLPAISLKFYTAICTRPGGAMNSGLKVGFLCFRFCIVVRHFWSPTIKVSEGPARGDRPRNIC